MMLKTLLALTITVAGLSGPPSSRPADPGDATPRTNPKWLERIDKTDRVYFETLTGFAPPPLAGDLLWPNHTPIKWNDLRGKVVVVQSWSSKTSAGRQAPHKARRSLADSLNDDVVLLLLHTPENASKLERVLQAKPIEDPIVVDRDGALCDALGVYKRPVNIVIDRQGAVRYAGLTLKGLSEAVATLLEEPYTSSQRPPERNTQTNDDPPAAWPIITGAVANAVDVRGSRAPEFYAQQWITRRPEANGKVVVVDFWATWCKPCVNSIPHLNDLADAFPNDVVVVGMSDESSGTLQSGLRKLERDGRLPAGGFRYAVATDPNGRMKDKIKVTAIPHAIVMSSDWVVRWQGHPGGLTTAILGEIVAADRAENAPRGDGARRRWRGGD